MSALNLGLANEAAPDIFLACLVSLARMHFGKGEIPFVAQILGFSPSLLKIVETLEMALDDLSEEC